MDAPLDAIPAALASSAEADLDEAFRQNYNRLVRVIGRVVGDQSRAEELAVDAFLRWWRKTGARGDEAAKWLYRVAVRIAIDELRRDARRVRHARLLSALVRRPATPEDLHRADDERRRVRAVLATLPRRSSSLLLLRGEGLSYQELAAALGLNPASVGTLMSRAQRAFRTEYERRYDRP